MLERNEGKYFPNLDAARKIYGLPADATEQNIIDAIAARLSKLGIKGNTIEELTKSVQARTREIYREEAATFIKMIIERIKINISSSRINISQRVK